MSRNQLNRFVAMREKFRQSLGLSFLLLAACARGSPGKPVPYSAQDSSFALQAATAPATAAATVPSSTLPTVAIVSSSLPGTNANVKVPSATTTSAPATEVNSDGDRVPRQWDLSEMALPAFESLGIGTVPTGVVIRMLMWKVERESSQLTASEAILWIRYEKGGKGSRQHFLTHVIRNEEQGASWYVLDIISDYAVILRLVQFDHAPTERELQHFIERTYWDVQRAVPRQVLDAEVCAHAWKLCTGRVPKRAYHQ